MHTHQADTVQNTTPLAELPEKDLIEIYKNRSWREMTNMSNSALQVRLNEPSISEALWRHYFELHFPNQEKPTEVATYSEAFLTRYDELRNLLRVEQEFDEEDYGCQDHHKVQALPESVQGIISDEDFALGFTKRHWFLIPSLPSHLLHNKSFVLKIIARAPELYDLFPEEIREDEDISFLAVTSNPEENGWSMPGKLYDNEAFLFKLFSARNESIQEIVDFNFCEDLDSSLFSFKSILPMICNYITKELRLNETLKQQLENKQISRIHASMTFNRHYMEQFDYALVCKKEFWLYVINKNAEVLPTLINNLSLYFKTQSLENDFLRSLIEQNPTYIPKIPDNLLQRPFVLCELIALVRKDVSNCRFMPPFILAESEMAHVIYEHEQKIKAGSDLHGISPINRLGKRNREDDNSNDVANEPKRLQSTQFEAPSASRFFSHVGEEHPLEEDVRANMNQSPT